MQSTQPPSEATASGLLTTAGSIVGLSLGPSVIAVLAFSPFIPSIEQEFGWSRVQVSLAVTIVSYMIVIVSPLQGLLVDRFGPRRVILASIPLFALGLGAFYFQPNNLYVFYALWALIPVLGLGLWPLSYLQAVSRWFDRHLGFALGCANAGIGVGSTVVPLIIVTLINLYDWRTAFLGLAALILFVSWPAVYLCLREPPTGSVVETPRGGRPSEGIPFHEAVRTPAFVLLLAAFLLLGSTATSLVTQQVPLLMEAGWTATRAAYVQSTFGFALLFARVLIGFVIDRVFAPLVMLAVSLGGALACVLYATYPDAGLLSAVLLGLLLGAEFDVLAFLIKRYFGNAAYGRLYGVVFAVFYLGSGLGIAGLSMSRQLLGSYQLGLYLSAGILVLCALFASLLPPYRFDAAVTSRLAPTHRSDIAR